MPSDTPKPFRQFHTWFDGFREPILLLSGSGTVLAVNAGFVQFAGSQQIVGKKLSRFASAPPHAVHQYIEACSTSEEPMEGNLILQDQHGNFVSCRCEGVAVTADARPAARRGLLRLLMVTRLTAEEAGERAETPGTGAAEAGKGRRLHEELRSRIQQLAQTEALVRSVIENVLDGLITINEKGIILTVNSAAERIFGYTADELFGQNVSMLMPEPYRSQHDRYVANYLRTGEAKIIGIGREVVGRRKDGSQFPLYLGISEFRLEDRRYFTGIVQDITERKRSENVAHFLADASRSLATVLDYASTLQKIAYLAVPFFAEWCTVHIVEEDGSLHQLAAAHIDPDKSELAQQLASAAPPNPRSPLGPAHVARTGTPQLVTEISASLIEGVAPDREHREILRQLGLNCYMGVPLRVRGKVFGVLSFFSADPQRKYDAADLALAEDLARRAGTAVENALLYRDLRDADRRKDEFLAMLAHELRNPLAPIRSGLDLLAIRGTEPEVVSMMQQQLEHLVRLVDDLLDVSLIVRGKVDLRREIVDLRTVVDRAVDAMRPAIGRSQQELILSLPPRPIHVLADPVRLAQVVTNLLSNANKYTGKGGHLWLSVEQQGQGAALSVRDDGMGISGELLPHVFDLFSQADRSLERSQGGLGIGLTLVRSLVEMHDGTVKAASEGAGKGSEFTVLLPMREPVQPKTPPKAWPVAAAGRRILIVEDNVAAARMLSRVLAELGGHDIRMVHDGLSALEEAKTHRPEIVLLDIGLPRMNGFEVAQKLRQQPEFRDTVLVAVTGYGTEEDRRRSAEVGFDRHLTKPPSLDDLLEVLAHPRLTRV